jgi:acetyl esterase/lipase
MFSRLFCLRLIAASLFVASPVFADEPKPKVSVKTYTYKKVGDLEIKADVHRADDATTRPVLVWIHGGALIMGNRLGIDGRLKQKALDAGFAIVSIDYRLAPETRLPEIIQDVEDAFKWVREQGPQLFHIDPNRLAVAGGSAGGYLTLVTGYRVQPRPRALVSLYGYGDLVGDWYSTPSPHPRHQTVKMSSEEAHAQVSGPPISDARDRKGNGGAFYQFCRQHGTWPKEVSGWDPHAATEKEKFVPFMPARNVTREYPPTLLIHGTQDTDVPYEQSVIMADAFTQLGVAHKFVTIPDAEHGLAGGEAAMIEKAYQSAIDFIRQHTQ